MCYAIPGKVIDIKDKIATVEYFGEQKKAINEIDDLKIGDYVYAQGGYIIKNIPQDEALSILSTWKETFFELQELDLRLSRLDLEKTGIDKRLANTLDRVLEGEILKRDNLLYLLNLEKDKELALLFKTANFLRQKNLGNSCCVHGIIEFSNYCSQRCAYCGISSHNRKLQRYRMTKDEIVNAAGVAIETHGFKALVLQSGEDPYYSIDDLCGIIKEIKSRFAVLIFVSFGEVGLDGLKKLYDAGARGLLMRFETSNTKLYEKLHSCHSGESQNLKSIDTRIAHLKEAYRLGYLIITGGLIGLPGQTDEDILNDIFLAKELNTEMYSFGPFLPHPATPLKDEKAPDIKKVLKALAVCRLVGGRDAKILVTTGFETLHKKAREEGLLAGANSVMLNVTPEEFAKDYTIYPNRAHAGESIQNQIDETLMILRGLGRAPTDLGIGG